MAGFWTRTRRFLAALWLGAIAVELVVLWLAHRTNSSWVLLLGLALLVVPLVATDRTLHWFGRAKRKRWKRHDVQGAPAHGEPDPAPAPRPPPAAG